MHATCCACVCVCVGVLALVIACVRVCPCHGRVCVCVCMCGTPQSKGGLSKEFSFLSPPKVSGLLCHACNGGPDTCCALATSRACALQHRHALARPCKQPILMCTVLYRAVLLYGTVLCCSLRGLLSSLPSMMSAGKAYTHTHTHTHTQIRRTHILTGTTHRPSYRMCLPVSRYLAANQLRVRKMQSKARMYAHST